MQALDLAAAAITPAPEARWWTVADVAIYRGVTPRTVYNWIALAKKLRLRGETGGIPFSQPRGTKLIRFRPEAVRAFFGDEEAA